MRNRYVELNRTFFDFDLEGHEYDPDTLRAIVEMTGRKTDWDELLKSRYVVVLGEAGSGKTWEFQEKAQRLSGSNKTVFFCKIEDLADEGLEQALATPEEVKLLHAWLEGTEEAVFFLDSIDEARLKGFRLETPLRKLAHSLDRAMYRARLLISCRVSDWRADSDPVTIEAILPTIEESEADSDSELSGFGDHDKSKGRLRIVQIAPLNRDQVAKLSAALGVDDTEALLLAIDDADAWHFAERPKDVEWITEYWKEKCRLGSLTELIQYNVKKKLLESNLARKGKDPLSPEEAELGAKTLAAASTFCKKSTFLMPDDHIDPERAASALDPQAVLHSWSSNKVEALLTRAIFDEATYGRVRFHHRSVIEYLTALWLKDRLDEGCPHRNIERLLFQERYGCKVAVPSLAPAAAWLSGWDDKIREKAMRVSPDILLQFGDPQAIPIQQRDRLLGLYAKRYADRQYTGQHFEWATLKRFAHEDLAPIIQELLTQYRAQNDVRELLIRLVESGRISACSETALSIAINEIEDQGPRLHAIRAVGSCGHEPHLRELAEYVKTKSADIPNRVLGVLCETLFPHFLSVDELLDVLRETDPQSPGSSRLLPFMIERITKYSTKDLLLDLLKGLVELAQEIPHINEGNSPVSGRFYWLSGPITNLLLRILSELPPDRALSPAVVSAIGFLEALKKGGLNHFSELKDVAEALNGHPAIRQMLFWRRVAVLRSPKNIRMTTYAWRITMDSLWTIGPDDFEWLAEDLYEKPTVEDRLLALDGALACWTLAGEPKDQLDRMMAAIGDEPALRERLDMVVNPPPRKESEFEKKIRKERKTKKRNKEDDFRKALEYLKSKIENIQEGRNFSALIYLWKVMMKKESSNHLGLTNWQSLITDFGEEVAEAACDGFKAYWRNWKPPLPHEQAEPNAIEDDLLVGLTGLSLAARDGFDFRSLSEKQAEIATRYAIRDNQFPDWLPVLVETHPNVVRATLATTLEAAFSINKVEAQPSSILSNLSYGAPSVRNLCAPDLFSLLRKEDPENTQVLENALHILLSGDNIDKRDLANLATERTAVLKTDVPRFMAWLAAWFFIDGEKAVEFLKTYLNELRSKDADNLVLKFCNTLRRHSEHSLYKSKADYLRATVLRILIPLTYKYIRPEEDLSHEKVYSPNARDRAQEFRDGLVHHLVKTSGKEAYQVLLEMADNQYTSQNRDWFLSLTQEKAAKDAEHTAWEPKDITRFTKEYETNPRSAHHLFEIALSRLIDIGHDIETGDHSERDLFNSKTHERAVSKWIANRLKLLAKGQYSVVLEEEVDKGKKPDIRIHSPGIEGPVGIEVKCANKYSHSELEATLAQQLVGQYLRDIRSQHGILLMAHLGGKQWWVPGDGSGRLNFLSLVERLKAKATQIAGTRRDIAALQVVGIYFTQ